MMWVYIGWILNILVIRKSCKFYIKFGDADKLFTYLIFMLLISTVPFLTVIVYIWFFIEFTDNTKLNCYARQVLFLKDKDDVKKK